MIKSKKGTTSTTQRLVGSAPAVRPTGLSPAETPLNASKLLKDRCKSLEIPRKHGENMAKMSFSALRTPRLAIQLGEPLLRLGLRSLEAVQPLQQPFQRRARERVATVLCHGAHLSYVLQAITKT